MMDPNNADVIRELVDCLGDIASSDGGQTIPMEFERKLKKTAIEQLTDSTELRLLLVASLFKLRDSQRALTARVDELEKQIGVIDGRTKERLRAMRGLL